MRCLYCNKELALLKRLTGGAEFCSDAHRKKYQEEFNDLALNRLMNAPPPPTPSKPLTPPEPEALPEPVTAAPPPPPPPVPRPRPAATTGPKLVPASAPAAAEKKAPQAKDPAVAGYLIEEPVRAGIRLVVAAGETNIPGPTSPELPSHAFEAAASDSGFSRANRISIQLGIEREVQPIRPREGSVEIREFSRQAVPPAPPPAQDIRTNDSALSSAIGEAMEITNQPRPPADPPVIWQAGPQPLPAIDLVLGELSRLDFAVTDLGEDSPPGAPRVTQTFAPAPAVPTASPVAVAPSAPRLAAEEFPVSGPQSIVPQPPTQAVPEPATQPLPVSLQGVAAVVAKPQPIISAGVSTIIEPQVPASSALPLRPTMILAARPATPASPAPVASAPQTPIAAPKPAAAAPLPPAAPKPVPQPIAAPKPIPAPAPPPPPVQAAPVRPVRSGNGKNRRPEVRVVQASGPNAAPPPQPTVAQAPAVQPARPLAPEPPKQAAKVEAPRPEPVKPAKPEVDLNLPVLHSQEVSGPWAKLPGAAKAGIGAVLALGIVGAAYTVFNGSNATATTTAKVVPTYQLGKQINSGGWIEDWAPDDKLRRVTLLRGSQPFSDYRMEFQAQIQNKAIGWMYRGLNPKNYYVVKLEKLKSGLEPVVALVRYAVIDGVSEKRVEKALPLKVRVDTMYKVRFDAVGAEFAVWVNDKKIDDWRDSRLGSGGLGLYAEGEEAAAVSGTVNVFELVSTK